MIDSLVCFIFISYYPLKQGLKLRSSDYGVWCGGFIYILLSIKTRIETPRIPRWYSLAFAMIYILLSIKTRIETISKFHGLVISFLFISYYPLKQGLKHLLFSKPKLFFEIYILLSIKTRIETVHPAISC